MKKMWFLGALCALFICGTVYAGAGSAEETISPVTSLPLAFTDDIELRFGTGLDVACKWDTNSTGDDLFVCKNKKLATTDTAAMFISRDLDPSAMTAFDNYLSPTWIMVNDEGADANDFTAVVIGARATADVAVANYFDLQAITGTADGSANATTTELAPIFRIGAAGTATTGHSLSAGDVLFSDDVEIDGATYHDGLVTYSVSAAITASTTQTQGQVPLTTTINNISVCANAGDAVTLPAAQSGLLIYIFNNGANAASVFPASGDAIDGGAVDAAVSQGAGANLIYVAHDATNWNRIHGAL